MKICLVAALFFSVSVLGTIEKLGEKKDIPKLKIKLSRGDTITIEQFLGKNQKSKKGSTEEVVLTLLCLKDNKKRQSSYSCDTVNLKPISGLTQ